VVTYTIQSSSFPSAAHADYVKQQTSAALQDWGINGIQFRYIDEKDLQKATFFIRYSKKPSGGTVARAFFPTSEQQDLVIFPLGFSSGQIKSLKNVLAHELGHAYGLRHEFALQEGSTVQFGPSNAASVMNYNNPPVIQASDRTWLQKLYNKAEPVEFIGNQNFPVKRYTPFSG